MREMDWPEPPPLAGVLIETGALRVTLSALGGATLISGDLRAALDTLAPGAPMLGLGGAAPDAPFALRIARDRVLLVTDAPLEAEPGWYAAGYATTPADDQWSQVLVTGPDAGRVIAEGTAADLGRGSPSAALLFAGLTCLLLRREEDFAIMVETPRLWFLAEWLAAVAGDPRG